MKLLKVEKNYNWILFLQKINLYSLKYFSKIAFDTAKEERKGF